MVLINCEIELDLSWSKECIISEISITPRIAGNSNARPPIPDSKARKKFAATFQINNVGLYIPVATLSIYKINFL